MDQTRWNDAPGAAYGDVSTFSPFPGGKLDDFDGPLDAPTTAAHERGNDDDHRPMLTEMGSEYKAPLDGSDTPHVVSSTPRHPPRRILRYWVWEFGGLLLSVGLFGAIAGILAHYDGQVVPDWHSSINLTTLIATLATILRAVMVVLVGEVLGQAKWLWFTTDKPTPLENLQRFDGASRGPWGSLRLMTLLLSSWGRGITSLVSFAAALVTIVSLAIGPMTQQALRTGACTQAVPDVNSTLPIANYAPSSDALYHMEFAKSSLMPDMQGVMLQALTNSGSGSSAIEPYCPTGNCTWPDYGRGFTHASIGFCSRCFDTSAKTNATSFTSKTGTSGEPDSFIDTNITLSGTPTINAFGDRRLSVGPGAGYLYRDLDWAADIFPPEVAEVAAASVLNLSVLALSSAPCVESPDADTCLDADSYLGYVSTSCVFYPCMRTYHAKVEVGSLTEQVISSVPALEPITNVISTSMAGNEEGNYTALLSPCVVDSSGTWYTEANITSVPKTPDRIWANDTRIGSNGTMVPDECLYKMYLGGMDAIREFMATDLLTGTCGYSSGSKEAWTLWGYNDTSCDTSWWLMGLARDLNLTTTKINTTMNSISEALTNQLRITGRGAGNSDEVGTVEGVVMETYICVFFTPRWLLLPATLLAINVFCLVAMITHGLFTARGSAPPVWKNSLLPLLFYPIRDRDYPREVGQGMAGNQQSFAAADLQDRTSLKARAKRTMVRLDPGDEPGFVRDVPTGTAIDREDESYSMDSLLQARRDAELKEGRTVV